MKKVDGALFLQDTQLTACNDDQYFVFEDTLYQVLLCFLRDKTIPQYLTHVSVFQGKKDESQSFIYPPSGVIPFYGFSMYGKPKRSGRTPSRCIQIRMR